MCGLAGIIAPELDPVARATAVNRALARQHHRGPDETGLVSVGPATLGLTRLAIIDPAHGRQPMRTADGRFTLVFNGALYNHRELRAELSAAGYPFRTACDTEVLLAAFAHDGPACLPRLRGMFAFAVWDDREHTLFAARDPLGIKPLYHARLPGRGLIFASELNALLASGCVPRELDPTAVADYLAWFNIPAPRTIYQGLHNLLPGHHLTLTADGRVHTAPWWRLPGPPPAAPITRNYAEFAHGLRAQLEDTIRAHRVADVPVGAFLSGGLDSTAVVALMARTGAANLKTFSLIFDEAGYSEQAPARLAARAFGTLHTEDLLTGRRVADDLPRILAACDQPTGDGINTYYASRLAHAGGVKVALSGLGGDELFGGYPSLRQLPALARFLPWWRRAPARLRAAVLARLHAATSTRARKLADFLTHARDLHELAALQRRVLPSGTQLSLLAPEARAAAERLGPLHPRLDDLVAELADTGADTFQTISAWELRTYMADVLLRDSDVFSMAHSLELRVPFADTRLLHWLWAQPAHFKDRDPARPKLALADAVADLLPTTLRQRPKQGFTLPFPLWMRAELRPFLDEVFSDSSLAACPWLEPAAAQQLWRAFATGTDPRAWSRVWTVAMLIAFVRRPAAVTA